MEITTSETIAAGALIISIISLAFSIEARLRDKYRLKVDASMGITFGDGPEQYHICVVATNYGRRPIYLVEIYFEENSEELGEPSYPIRTPIEGGLCDRHHPFELAENQTKRFESEPVSRKSLLQKTKILEVGVVDSKGKQYLSRIENEAYNFMVTKKPKHRQNQSSGSADS